MERGCDVLRLLTLAADVAPTIDPSTILPAMSTLCSLGFAVWYAWHVTTKAMPDQQKEHRDQLRDITDSHNKLIDKLVSDFRTDCDKLAQQYERWFRTAANKQADGEDR